MTTQIELHPAHVWDCDNCGKENFERSIVAELSEEEMQGLMEEYGIDRSERGNFCSAPYEVTCKHCGSCFDVVTYESN